MTRTVLFLHAHPDDECILTGASMAKAKAAGLRVIVAYATRGDAGETNADLGDQTLGERREHEARAACDELDVDRVLFLGFDDSGMAETETTRNPGAFCNASVEEATARLGMALVNEDIDIVVGYDRNGTYGHPDHIQIHHLGRHAAPELGAQWVLDASYNREYFASLGPMSIGDDEATDSDETTEPSHESEGQAPEDTADDGPQTGYDTLDEKFALSIDELTHFVEGPEFFEAKMTAITHHQSQTPDDFEEGNTDMIQEFNRRFGTEWFLAVGVGDNPDPTLLDGFCEPKDEWSGAPPALNVES